MGEIAGLQPRSSDVPQDDGFTYMDGSAVRHIVQACLSLSILLFNGLLLVVWEARRWAKQLARTELYK